jgi:predicted PurR-regulated permease PerM
VENQELLLFICAVYLFCILVFWPLMTVVIWSAAIAVALFPFHKQLSL